VWEAKCALTPTAEIEFRLFMFLNRANQIMELNFFEFLFINLVIIIF